MRFSHITTTAATAWLACSAVNGLNILITNDDGFGTANIRELYKAVIALGHKAYIVASATNQSGMGGTSVFTTYKNLTQDTEFGIVKAGSPSIGTDPNDSHIWYYNGTPATQVLVALDYILPKFNFTPDLVLSGPNYGTNLGPFLYTLSGTIGATYTAIERGYPAIAFSGGYSVQTPYYQVNTTTAAGLPDVATITGRLCANLAQQVINNAKGGRILPLGYGLSVNLPYITSFTNNSCINPPFIQTRMTGGADIDQAVYNATSGLFGYTNIAPAGLNQCINGDCSLPGETTLVNSGCKSSVSVFTIDYDAPSCSGTQGVRNLLLPLVQYNNATTFVGGLNGTSFGNSSTTASASSVKSTATATSSVHPTATTATPVFTGAAAEMDVTWRAAGIVGAAMAMLL